MDKNSGIYLMLHVHLFDASEVEFLKRQGLKQKPQGRNRNRKLKRAEISILTRKQKKVSRVVKREIHFNRYETQTKSFQIKKHY